MSRSVETCPRCGIVIKGHQRFCSECGATLDTVPYQPPIDRANQPPEGSYQPIDRAFQPPEGSYQPQMMEPQYMSPSQQKLGYRSGSTPRRRRSRLPILILLLILLVGGGVGTHS